MVMVESKDVLALDDAFADEPPIAGDSPGMTFGHLLSRGPKLDGAWLWVVVDHSAEQRVRGLVETALGLDVDRARDAASPVQFRTREVLEAGAVDGAAAELGVVD